MIMDNGLDDKCPSCGEWTLRAFEKYGGLYNDGTAMDYCACDYQGEEDELAPKRVPHLLAA